MISGYRWPRVVVRNLDESVKNRLKQRAARRGHSMEAEIRDILNKAVGEKERREEGLGTLITRHFAGKGIGIDFEIPEWRGKEARPARFRK
jgi:plasmid stability protein